MQYDKLQLGCLLIVLYVAFIYVRERYAYKIEKRAGVCVASGYGNTGNHFGWYYRIHH